VALKTIKLDPPVTQTVNGKVIEYALQYDRTNGDVRLVESKENGQPTGSSNPKVIFGPKDGNWNANNITTLSATDQQQFKAQIQAKIKDDAKRTRNAVIPTWVNTQASPGPSGGSAPGTSSGGSTGTGSITDVIGNIGNFIDALANPFETFKDLSVSGVAWATKSEGTHSEVLKYPMNMLDSQDRLIIQCYRYNPPYQETFTKVDVAQTMKGGAQRNTPLKQVIGAPIILPMPQSARDSASVAWDVDAMNNITMAATGLVGQNMVPMAAAYYGLNGIGGLTGTGNLGSAIIPLAVQLKLLADAAGGVGKAGISAAALSNMLGKLGYDVSPESLLARGAGVIANSNQELLFKGAAMRTFSYSYQLTPRSEPEAVRVRKIIRRFKELSAARKYTGGAGGAGDVGGGSSFFLGTPNVWTLKYVTAGNKLIKGMNFIKPCALTRFEVDYTPQNHWMADAEGNPMSYRISMDFSELEPIYNTDYGTDPKVSGTINRDANSNAADVVGDLLTSSTLDTIGY